MAAAFSRGASRWLQASLLVAVFAVVATPFALMAWVRGPYVTGEQYVATQPVAFDHRHHVVDDGIDCLYCHSDAESSAVAGVPATEVCMNCHSQIWNRSAAIAPVIESYYAKQPIRWQRVHHLPDFVFFNHAIHVRGGIACERCHGRVDQMARVERASPLTMGWCLDCHEHSATQTGVRSLQHCSACHR